jgi:hypothetical protein
MARQYEVALSEVMYELAERKKRGGGLPSWAAPTAMAAGVVGGAALGHKLTPAVYNVAHRGAQAVRKGADAAFSAGKITSGQRAGRYSAVIKALDAATKYGGRVAGGVAGGAALGVPVMAMRGNKKKGRR